MAKVPTLELVFDEEAITLAFDLNAIVLIEEDTGIDLLNGTEDLDMKAGTVRSMFWAGALRHHPEITKEKVGSLIHIGNIEEVAGKVSAFFNESFPQAGEQTTPGNAEAVSA